MSKDRDSLIIAMAVARQKVEDLRGTLMEVEDQLYYIEAAYKRILGEDEPIDLFFRSLTDRVLNPTDDFDNPDESYEDLLERDDASFESYWETYYDEFCGCDECSRYRNIITNREIVSVECRCEGAPKGKKCMCDDCWGATKPTDFYEHRMD